MKKVVIFDFDYTLGDSTPGIVESMHYAFETMGLPKPSADAIRRTVGRTLCDSYAILTGDEDISHGQRFTALFKEKADEIMTGKTVLFDGILECLAALKRKGVKLGIVTTKLRYRIEGIMAKYGAEDLFDLVVGSEDVKVEKPSPEGLLWAIDALKAAKEDVLYVGDSIVDAKTAQNAGVDFAAVLTGTTEREAFLEYPHIEIADNVTKIKASPIGG